MIQITGLAVRYGRGKIIDIGSLTIPETGIRLIVGENGSGKTSLIRAVLRIADDFEGSVTIDGRDNSSMTRLELARAVSYLPQTAPVEPYISVEEFIRQGLYAADSGRFPEVVSALELDGLLESVYSELSGGQKQLCRLARAMVPATPYVFLDEPDAFLSKRNRALFVNLIERYKTSQSIVIVSHHSGLPYPVLKEFEQSIFC